MKLLKTSSKIIAVLASLSGATVLLWLAIGIIVHAYQLPEDYLKKGLEIFTCYLIALPLCFTVLLALSGVALVPRFLRLGVVCQWMAAFIQFFLSTGGSYGYPLRVVFHISDDTLSFWASVTPAFLFGLGGLISILIDWNNRVKTDELRIHPTLHSPDQPRNLPG